MLREVARAQDRVGSRQRGLEELNIFLCDIGVEDKQYNFEDGSGLSRLTLVTPRTVSKLLVHMYGTPYREVWISTFPVGGRDGTLFLRFHGAPDAANIRGKTGAISHVSALAGYALRPDGNRYAFSILANNYNGSAAVIRQTIDQVALAILNSVR